ncbi:hypothetical protein CTAYLR_004998 [Chrysophaeum taylorii]|uniref:GTP-binding protein n=1 Tax=Chrysophaeum taylorii TaxID=2483200 RepID=A0AAD7UAL6_9STRA|nr:hypothetical protein CTAYLR_004998 [Chrysophaeum taylorii]
MARQVKVVLVGDGSVGKSSLVARFVREGFVQRYAQTVGVDFYEKRIQVRGEVFADLQIWDIGGQSIRSKMLPRYLSGAQVVFVVYDLSNRDSLLDADDWLAQLNAVYPAKKKKEPPDVYAVGNKADLIHCRQVSDKDHDLFWRSRAAKTSRVLFTRPPRAL